MVRKLLSCAAADGVAIIAEQALCHWRPALAGSCVNTCVISLLTVLWDAARWPAFHSRSVLLARAASCALRCFSTRCQPDGTDRKACVSPWLQQLVHSGCRSRWVLLGC